jgi:hypothetical protein
MREKIVVFGSETWTDKDKIKREIGKYNHSRVFMGMHKGAEQLTHEAVFELGGDRQNIMVFTKHVKHILKKMKNVPSHAKRVYIFNSTLLPDKRCAKASRLAKKYGCLVYNFY